MFMSMNMNMNMSFKSPFARLFKPRDSNSNDAEQADQAWQAVQAAHAERGEKTEDRATAAADDYGGGHLSVDIAGKIARVDKAAIAETDTGTGDIHPTTTNTTATATNATSDPEKTEKKKRVSVVQEKDHPLSIRALNRRLDEVGEMVEAPIKMVLEGTSALLTPETHKNKMGQNQENQDEYNEIDTEDSSVSARVRGSTLGALSGREATNWLLRYGQTLRVNQAQEMITVRDELKQLEART